MAISLTPAQLKAICPEGPASAILTLNSILARTGSVTYAITRDPTPERLDQVRVLYERACWVLAGGHELAA